MAKVNIKGLRELQQRLNRRIKIRIAKLFTDESLRKLIGRIIVDDIKKNYESKKSPSDSTLKWRNIYDKLNKTDPAYKPTKIKAVFTGELLEDLANNVLGRPTDLSFEVKHSNNRHRKYKGPNGEVGSESLYSEISKGLINDMGYNYMVLSEGAQKEIANLIRNKLYELIAQMSK